MNQPPFHIMPAARAHVPAIHAMVRELADYEKLTHLLSGTALDLEAELFGARPVIEAIVALADGVPTGFALYFHNYSTFLARKGLYLEDLYVKPAFRRRGIGRALLVRLARIAVERGCGRFEWSVLDWNTPAIQFYEGLGATVMPDWRIARVTGEALRSLATRSAPSDM
ncbi:MAG: GNAT family N-acetyltransferase [Betaproteobacteria bacterium]|nr:GNAT family N-acetyltransferase [Betaproteobacteria bacterium]